jgi:hypothetical protein
MDLVACAIGIGVFVFFNSDGIYLRDHVVHTVSRSLLPRNYYAVASKPKLDMVVSLTTSPGRLRSLNLDTFANCRVILNLPRLFRNEEEYDSAGLEALKKYPNLVVNWIERDLGPQTKLLGALGVTESHQYILVIDDDIAYSGTIIDAYQDAINTSTIDRVVYCAKPEVIGGFHVCPGFSSFCVRRSLLPATFADHVALNERASEYCKRHDDFLFAAAFHDMGLQVKRVRMPGPLALPVGFDDGALHIQGPSAIKHVKCAAALWKQRAQCPSY